MKFAVRFITAAVAGLVLSVCTTGVMAQATSAAESACMAAVNKKYGGRESSLEIVHSEFSQANSLVIVEADSERWRCLSSNDGNVEELSIQSGASGGSLQAASGVFDELVGTKWRLVQIMSMDDSEHIPGDPEKYTLKLAEDGSAAIQADCNRGTGNWTSEGPNQLQFGPVAATMAICPPGSIGDVYMAQFQWVRSYTMKDGHLFLATMADGSIIEFEPVTENPAVAIVLGEKLYASAFEELQGAIITSLFDRYAAERGITVKDSEVNAFISNMERGMKAEGLDAADELSPEEQAEVADMRRSMASSMIRQWKLNRALYAQYGGRIIYQQLGPEPLDAYRMYLKEQQAGGALDFLDPELEAEFWGYFSDETRHDFMDPDSGDARKAFSRPPWEGNP